MAQFFGKEVDFTGTEILVKVGTRYNDPTDPGHELSWRDGQIISIRPLGYHTAKFIGYCLLLIKLPNVNYIDIGGKTEEGWGDAPGRPTLYDRLMRNTNSDGKYKWELIEKTPFEPVRKTRDYFIDLAKLRRLSYFTESVRENIYDHDVKTIITLPSVTDLRVIVSREGVDTREDSSKILRHASITTGDHTIGSGLDYDDLMAGEAAMGATLTGAFRFLHNAESTSLTDIVFDFNCDGNQFTITHEAGDRHSGIVTTGARLAYGGYAEIDFNESTAGHLSDIAIVGMAFDASPAGCIGLVGRNCSDSGLFRVDSCVIKGGATSRRGIFIDYQTPNIEITNNIIYDMQDASQGQGIEYYWTTGSLLIANNTIIAARQGIHSDAGNTGTGQIMRNNLIQACTSADYVTDGGWTSNTSFNVSEDASSPDAAYDNTDVNTNSVFTNYASDDFTLDSAGDATNLAILDDGADLSGTFTNDVVDQTRSTWYIGASEIVAAGGASPKNPLGHPLIGAFGGPIG